MPSLVFDMMEPFRPVMDKLLFTAVLQKTLPETILDNNSIHPRITKEGRHALIQLFNNRMQTRAQVGNASFSLNNLILHEVKMFTGKLKEL
jgi:CRISPR/Cas system-associated endonuclease Cas1